MVFTSHIFIFYFLPLVLLCYYLLPGRRNIFLLCASYIFYGWWNPWFVFLMLFATAVNYIGGHIIADPASSPARRKTAMIVSVVVSLGTLAFFKYFVFLQSNVNGVIELFGASALPIFQVTLPVGISFYIFQSMTYSIDVYRGESPPVRSFFDFACFVSLFPQLIAGPIVRYNTIARQLVDREHSLEKFNSGVMLFILGFSKKILLANMIGKAADDVFGAEAPYMIDAWFGVAAYTFQIYFDFSAYSDMAIGLGRMFGFEFPRNFNAPYRSESITDFWRRWHISLSTFLRDYLYLPLGGNRKSLRRTYVNLAIVMLLGGLWHGANWTFVCWGAFHGALLIFERWLGKRSPYAILPRPFRVGLTFVLILFSWVLFRAETMSEAFEMFQCMLGFGANAGASALLAAQIYTPGNFVMMAICAVFSFQPVQAFDIAERSSALKTLLLLSLFVFAVCVMFVQSFNPFLYFQF